MARPRSNFDKASFYFHRCDPGKGPLNENEWKLTFEAHITSINDSSNPSYNENFDMGRADPKVFYAGANRQYTVSFFVIATNKNEHFDNHEKLLAKLGRMTYPIYSPGSGYNSPHVQFKIGNLVKGYGVITSLTYDWKPEYPWMDGRPIYTDVNLTIKVLANSLGVRPDAASRYFI